MRVAILCNVNPSGAHTGSHKTLESLPTEGLNDGRFIERSGLHCAPSLLGLPQ